MPERAVPPSEPRAAVTGRRLRRISGLVEPALAGLLVACAAGPTAPVSVPPVGPTLSEIAIDGSSYLSSATACSDGAVWFTYQDPPPGLNLRIGRLTAAGEPKTFAASNEHHPSFIACADDGTIWFTGPETNYVGRLRPTDGDVSLFKVPTGRGLHQNSSFPRGIARGPDGAMWFAEETGNRIGRVDSEGTIIEYVLPSAGSAPVAIVAGPDSALWFTETGRDRIGRITTSGALTDYPVPTTDSQLGDIVAGPDGAMWFTETKSNRVGRIDAAGKVNEFALGGGPLGIAVGPDGALWVSESAAGKIARLMVDGRFAEYPLTNPKSTPGHVVVSMGALWVVENGQSKILRISVP